MRRLDDTAANLTRINDIKAEVEGQVEPLRLAAEQTRKFNLLDKELRACKLTQFVHKIENIENIRQKLNTQDAELENKVLERATAVSTQEAECSALQMELDKLSEAYNRIQDDIKEKRNSSGKTAWSGSCVGRACSAKRKIRTAFGRAGQKAAGTDRSFGYSAQNDGRGL